MSRPRLLDLFSSAGGAAKGYQRAGFHVTGVDIRPMPRYVGDEFYHCDAIEYLDELGSQYDAIHASPPCQGYSQTSRFHNYVTPELVEPVRDLLVAIGKPYVIENVKGAPLREPTELCGCMFPGQLKTYRTRLFETNWALPSMEHREHVARNAALGARPKPGEFMYVLGNYTGVQEAREAMGIDWMTRREMAEAIPPVYTEYIGCHLLAAVTGDGSGR